MDQPIDPSGPDAYFTTLPVRELADAVKAAGVPASLSLSAGTFVCNHIFYELQNALAGTGVRSGFVHVPLMDEQAAEFDGKPTMSIEAQLTAVRAFIGRLQE